MKARACSLPFLIALVSCGLILSATVSAATFESRRNYRVGNYVQSHAVGDLDNDGIPDLAAVSANYNDHHLFILTGTGSGEFGQRQELGIGDYPTGAAIGDVDNDGNADLAVAVGDSDSAWVFMGNGDGTFSDPVEIAAGDYPSAIALHHLDSDGNLDLVVVNAYADTVTVRLGNGDGTFQGGLHYPVDDLPDSLAIGDLNDDGHPDMVVGNSQANTISVMMANGNGTFQMPVTFGGFTVVKDVAIGDLTGDGLQDLALAIAATGDIAVLPGNGDGTFQAPYTVANEGGIMSVAIGDLDQDGTPDMAAANDDWDSISLHFGNSDGTFQTPVRYVAGNSPITLELDDLGNDGSLDITTANNLSHNVSVFLNRGDGSYPAASDFGARSYARFVTSGDLDGDGAPDLVVAASYIGYLSLLMGNGDGTYQPVIAIDDTIGSTGMAAALEDLDGDGNTDLAVVNRYIHGVSVFFGLGDGTFLPRVDYSRSVPGRSRRHRALRGGGRHVPGDGELRRGRRTGIGAHRRPGPGRSPRPGHGEYYQWRCLGAAQYDGNHLRQPDLLTLLRHPALHHPDDGEAGQHLFRTDPPDGGEDQYSPGQRHVGDQLEAGLRQHHCRVVLHHQLEPEYPAGAVAGGEKHLLPGGRGRDSGAL